VAAANKTSQAAEYLQELAAAFSPEVSLVRGSRKLASIMIAGSSRTTVSVILRIARDTEKTSKSDFLTAQSSVVEPNSEVRSERTDHVE
jgi:hypothetical protein